MMCKWGLYDSEACNCGHESQTIGHIVTGCPIRAFRGTMKDIHLESGEVVEWMDNLDVIFQCHLIYTYLNP